jgi:hypothetical protein
MSGDLGEISLMNPTPGIPSPQVPLDDGTKRIKLLLEAVKALPSGKVREANLFQIGGKGHFENPTTQLLEFFLDPLREHGFGSKVLDTLLLLADKGPGGWNTGLSILTQREVVIGDHAGKSVGRLDLVLESDEWILVLENKIRHQAINDFDAYAEFAKRSGKKFLLILLSVRLESPPSGWVAIQWSDLHRAVRLRVGLDDASHSFSKWHLFLREFLENVEFEAKGGAWMDKERFDFARSHAGDLLRAQDLFQDFLTEICNQWSNRFAEKCFEVRSAKPERVWQSRDGVGWRCVPVRFVLSKPDVEVVLKVFSAGGFGLNFYPRLGCGISENSLRRQFPPPNRVSKEAGYVACVVTGNDKLDLPAAETLALETLHWILVGDSPTEPLI